MKRTLREDLEKIHSITYGKKVLEEGFLDDVLTKVGLKNDTSSEKIDDPKKADFVNNNVNDFFTSLQKASEGGGLTQQSGSIQYQKEVESLQIGLMLLGYELPRHGVDGLFGPETAAAVTKFTNEKLIGDKKPLGESELSLGELLRLINENSNEILKALPQLGASVKGNELNSGGEVTDGLSDIFVKILKDFKSLNPNVKVTITSGNDRFHKTLGYKSKHTTGQAIDMVLNPYNSQSAGSLIDILNKYKAQDSGFNYIDEYTRPSGAATGGHFHLQYLGTQTQIASVVNQQPNTNNTIAEMVAVVPDGGGVIGAPGQGTHNAGDWQSGNAWDVTGPVGSEVHSITNGVVSKLRVSDGGVKRSGVKVIFGDQLTIKSNDGKPDVFYTHINATVSVGQQVKEGDVVGTIINMPGGPSHVHIGLSNGDLDSLASGLKNGGGGGGSTSAVMTKASPEMIDKLIELLKERGVKPEELQQYIDSVKTGGGAAFTDLDLTTEAGFNAYAEICQKFINAKQPNPLGITGVMMAEGAKGAFDRFQRFVPAELALAQMAVEGGIGNGNLDSRPIRTRNPFNVGNVDNGSNVTHNDVQSGINTYYNLIAKDYIGKGKTANDLVNSFVNKNNQRYASSTDYETMVSKLAGQANSMAQPIVASISKPNTSGTVAA